MKITRKNYKTEIESNFAWIKDQTDRDAGVKKFPLTDYTYDEVYTSSRTGSLYSLLTTIRDEYFGKVEKENTVRVVKITKGEYCQIEEHWLQINGVCVLRLDRYNNAVDGNETNYEVYILNLSRKMKKDDIIAEIKRSISEIKKAVKIMKEHDFEIEIIEVDND